MAKSGEGQVPLRTWLMELETVGIIRIAKGSDSGRQVRLRRPFELRVGNPWLQALKAAYRREFEIGGVLLFVPRLHHGIPRLEAAGLEVIPNVSLTPEFRYSPHQPSLNSAARAGLSGRLLGQRAFPLFFHSHPAHRPDLRPELGQLKEYFNLDTSTMDQCSTLGDWYQGTHRIELPRLLISGVEARLFVGAYGGGVLPMDFDREMRRPIEAFHKQMVDLPVEHGDPWWIVALKGLGVLVSGAALLGADHVDGAKQYMGTMLREFTGTEDGSRLYSLDSTEVAIQAIEEEVSEAGGEESGVLGAGEPPTRTPEAGAAA